MPDYRVPVMKPLPGTHRPLGRGAELGNTGEVCQESEGAAQVQGGREVLTQTVLEWMGNKISHKINSMQTTILKVRLN